MDDYLQDMTAREEMLLDAFQNDEIGDDSHVTYTLFESLKSTSATPIFGPGGQSKSTQLGTVMLLYKLKAKFEMLSECFSAILR